MKQGEFRKVLGERAKAMAKKKTIFAVDGPDSPFFVLAQIFGTLTIGMWAAIVTLQITLGFSAPPNFDWFSITVLLVFPLPFIWATMHWSYESVGATLYKLAHIAAFIWAFHIILGSAIVIGVHKGPFELSPVLNLSVALIVFAIVNIRIRRWGRESNKTSAIEQGSGQQPPTPAESKAE